MKQSSLSDTIISHSPDLQRLYDEGYEVEVRDGHLLLKEVPYLAKNKRIGRGTIVSVLTLQGHAAVRPADHPAWFTGAAPHDHNGNPLPWASLYDDGQGNVMGGAKVKCLLSLNPQGGYNDYYEKMINYERSLSQYAKKIHPNLTAQTFKVQEPDVEDYAFKYMDSATSRSRIDEFSERLAQDKVAIVGLGGTGSYILDMISKTHIKSIHLFDGDTFGTHNAFRSPGAASIAALEKRPTKADYFCAEYSKMKNNIFAHGYIDESTISLLREMSFVFIAAELGEFKRTVLDELEMNQIPFIDAGMDVFVVDGRIDGMLGITVSTDDSRGTVIHATDHSDDEADDRYASNIQIADLNALNAILAVIKWKKLLEFYRDTKNHYMNLYTIHSNSIVGRGTTRD